MNITARHQDGTTTLALTGELDMATVGLLDESVGTALKDVRPERLVIDVGGLDFCDSAGIHAFFRARQETHVHGATFQLTNARGITERTLQLSGVLDILATPSRAADTVLSRDGGRLPSR